MNEQTTKLLEQLAAKMGTTSEYLWGILVRQAAIDATINLIYLIIAVVLVIVLIRLHKRFCNDDSEVSYYKMDGVLIVPMFIASVIVATYSLIVLIISPGQILTGYLSPEYWALNKILETLTN